MITLRNPLQTPTSTINAIEIREVRRVFPSANGQGDDAWTVVVSAGGVAVPLCVKRQLPVQRIARDEEGKTRTDGKGAVIFETVDSPDAVDQLASDGEIRTTRVEVEGAFDAFEDALGQRGAVAELMKTAMLAVGMIPASLDPA